MRKKSFMLMRWIQDRKEKKYVRFLNEADVEGLVEKSGFIQSHCVDEPYYVCNGEQIFSHTIPLKDSSIHYLKKDNWDISDADKKEVEDYLSSLSEYAEAVLGLFGDDVICSAVPEEAKEICCRKWMSVSHKMLPPWFVYPLYGTTSLGWKMGAGEIYGDNFHYYIKSLREEDREKYFQKYPVPEYLNVRFGYLERERAIHREFC